MQNSDKAVLPWVANPPVKLHDHRQAVDNGVSLTSVGLSVNDKIEWWGARIMHRSGDEGSSDESGWVIRYDAFNDFEEEEATVKFFSKRKLVDVGQDAEMVWRKEGELDGDTTEAEVENDTVAISEVFEDLEDGDSVADIFNTTEVRRMPVSAQMRLATGIQAFKTSLAELFTTVQQEKGPNALVEVDDVERMKRNLREKIESLK